MKVAAEGKIVEVSYMFPRPGADKTPVQRVAFVTKVGDQACLVAITSSIRCTQWS
jgi:hypothetical protein